MRRECITEIQSERRAQVRAIMSNGGYLQTDKGLEARKQEIEQLNAHFDQALEEIMDPGKAAREQREIDDNPLFAAGVRGLEKAKWDMLAQREMAEKMRQQGLG